MLWECVKAKSVKIRVLCHNWGVKVCACLGFQRAQYELGSAQLSMTGYDNVQNGTEALLLRVATCGDVFAKWKLSRVYSAKNASMRDLKKAFGFLQDASNGGHVGAICALGCCYEEGIGVEKSIKDAARCYITAANYGLVPAQHNIGCCYKKGIGVKRDDEEAELWFCRAAENGYYDHTERKLDTQTDYAVIEFWNLVLMHSQSRWIRQFSYEFLDAEMERCQR